LYLLGRVAWFRMQSILVCMPSGFEKNSSTVVGCSALVIQICSVDWWCCWIQQCLLFLQDLSVSHSGHWSLQLWCGFMHFSLQCCSFLSHMVWSFVGKSYTSRIVISSWKVDPFIIMECSSFIHDNFPFFEVFSSEINYSYLYFLYFPLSIYFQSICVTNWSIAGSFNLHICFWKYLELWLWVDWI
jgi:hypothetical protein